MITCVIRNLLLYVPGRPSYLEKNSLNVLLREDYLVIFESQVSLAPDCFPFPDSSFLEMIWNCLLREFDKN